MTNPLGTQANQYSALGYSDHMDYVTRAKSVLGSDLVAHYPLWETSGATIADVSGNGYNGANNGTTLANSTSMMGKPVPLFGTSADIDIYSAGLAAAWPNVRYVGGFAKLLNSGVLTDAQTRYLFWVQSGSTADRVFLRRSTVDYQMVSFYVAGGTTESVNIYKAFTDWFHWSITWDYVTDVIIWHINGAEVSRSTGLGTWGGTIATNAMRIGSAVTNFWSGWQSNIVVGSKFVSAAEALQLASPINRPIRISLIGDSNTASLASTEPKWPEFMSNTSGRHLSFSNRAVGGATILDDMASQVTACASDNSDIIVMQLGQNDNDAGDMSVLQGIVETSIDTLRASNPSAKLKYMIPFPRWTSPTGTIVAKDNIRNAIRAACTVKGVPWKNTNDWFEAADTDDGTHGGAVMYTKIANKAYPWILEDF